MDGIVILALYDDNILISKIGQLGITHAKEYMLGSGVDKPSKILMKYWMQQNTLNQIFKTSSYQEQMILSSIGYKKIYLQGSLEGFLERYSSV